MDPQTIMMALSAIKGLQGNQTPYVLGKRGGQVIQSEDPFAPLSRIASLATVGKMAGAGLGTLFDKFKNWGQTTPGITTVQGPGYGGGYTEPIG